MSKNYYPFLFVVFLLFLTYSPSAETSSFLKEKDEIRKFWMGAGINSASYFLEGNWIFNYPFGLKVGVTAKPLHLMGKEVSTQLWNYGRTIDGHDDSVFAIDIGASYFVLPRLQFSGVFSMGSQNFYTQYIDHRFTGDHYYIQTKNNALFGMGMDIAYYPTESFACLIKYSTLYGIGVGVKIAFSDYNSSSKNFPSEPVSVEESLTNEVPTKSTSIKTIKPAKKSTKIIKKKVPGR